MEPVAGQLEFDPWAQPIVLFNADGSNMTVSMEYFDMYRLYTARLALTDGAQVGATVTLLLVLLLLTGAEKRRSHIFITNALCLLTNAIRCILLSCWTTSTIWHPYAQISGDSSHIKRGDQATVIAQSVLTLIVTVLVMASLSLQVWVVCITTAPMHRYIIMGTMTVVACIATGFKFAMVIIISKQTLEFQSLWNYKKILTGSYVTQAMAIWLFSCVFTYKLGYAIVQRRKLKMPQFGPMQVVFIMGCQTMLIPGTHLPPFLHLHQRPNYLANIHVSAIFTGLQFNSKIPEFGNLVLTVVCIFLPLSAIWAGVVSENAAAPNAHDKGLIRGAFYRSKDSEYTIDSTSTSTTMMDRSRQMSVCTCANKSMASTPDTRKKSVAEYGDDAILIGREFGFSRDEAV
ncbi:fungal pheromone mating factor STE2 GPCR-domain-containing protein [Phaeosphaeria sp. MPI-PUGE-AT-0046c]|nr:fungal pheromone mating factor STE2 GPCR-domain-containing protein [Phaeosphaeria sp. MPI-PUGE-AT-0046c]